MHSKGFSLVEAILATALFGIGVAGFVGAFIVGSDSHQDAERRLKARLFAQEAYEVLYEMGATDFTVLTAGTYGLATSSNVWVLSGSNTVEDIYTREVEITDIDANRKNVVITVSWLERLMNRTFTLNTRITNWDDPVGVQGNWSAPAQTATLDISGNQNGLRVFYTDPYAFVVREGGTPVFLSVDTSATTTPVIQDSVNISGTPQDMWVDGDYAAVTSNQNNAELQIVDVSDPTALSIVGTLNLSGNTDGAGVYVSGTTVFVGRASSKNDDLFIVDITVPSAPTTLGSLELGATPNDIVVIGDYAFIASDNNSQELQVVDISTPSTPVLSASVDLSGNVDATAVTGFGSVLMLGRSDGEIVIFDISTPTAVTTLGTLVTGGTINDMYYDSANNLVFVASDDNTAEFRVLDISDTANPLVLGALDLSGNMNGVWYIETRDMVLGVTDDNSGEFTVIEP